MTVFRVKGSLASKRFKFCPREINDINVASEVRSRSQSRSTDEKLNSIMNYLVEPKDDRVFDVGA